MADVKARLIKQPTALLKARLEAFVDGDDVEPDTSDLADCCLELLKRVEALEAAAASRPDRKIGPTTLGPEKKPW